MDNEEQQLKNILLDENTAGKQKAKIWGKDEMKEKISLAVQLFHQQHFFNLNDFAYLLALGNNSEEEFRVRITEFQEYKKTNSNATVREYYEKKNFDEKTEQCKEDNGVNPDELAEIPGLNDCLQDIEKRYKDGKLLIDDYPVKAVKGGRKNRRRTNKKRMAKRKSFRRRR
jgi:hypothetical protein